MITQEQADKMKALLEDLDECFCNDNSINWFNLDQILDEKDKLLAEIEANEPTSTATQAQNWTAIKAKTNGDRIRNMSDEEIAEEFMGYVLEDSYQTEKWLNERYEQILDWLKQEAKEND